MNIREVLRMTGRIDVKADWPKPRARVGRETFAIEPYSGTVTSITGTEVFRRTLTLGPVGSEGGTLEVFFPIGDEPEIRVRRGCFSGTLAAFAEQASNHKDPDHRRRYALIVEALALIGKAVE